MTLRTDTHTMTTATYEGPLSKAADVLKEEGFTCGYDALGFGSEHDTHAEAMSAAIRLATSDAKNRTIVCAFEVSGTDDTPTTRYLAIPVDAGSTVTKDDVAKHFDLSEYDMTDGPVEFEGETVRHVYCDSVFEVSRTPLGPEGRELVTVEVVLDVQRPIHGFVFARKGETLA